MSKQSPALTGATLASPPDYYRPRMDERVRPQYTGSSRTPYELELEDMQRQHPPQPRNYDDPYLRWRRGAENNMAYRPAARSKAANVFAVCCCGTVWGIVAWVVGLLIVIGGLIALIVKVSLPQADTGALPPHALASTASSLVTTTFTVTSSSPSVSTVTVTTSPQQPSTTTCTATTTSVSISVSTYSPPPTVTTTATYSSPQASTVTSTTTSLSTITTSSSHGSTVTVTSTASTTLGADSDKPDKETTTVKETITDQKEPETTGKGSTSSTSDISSASTSGSDARSTFYVEPVPTFDSRSFSTITTQIVPVNLGAAVTTMSGTTVFIQESLTSVIASLSAAISTVPGESVKAYESGLSYVQGVEATESVWCERASTRQAEDGTWLAGMACGIVTPIG